MLAESRDRREYPKNLVHLDQETHQELVEKTKEGDEDARQGLHQAQLDALRAMAEALEEGRQLI